MNMILKNQLGFTKEIKVGFSWTTLFFGCFPALFRGDWKWAIIMFLLAWLTGGLSWLVFPFFYNRLYIKDLLSKGYAPLDDKGKEFLQMKGFNVIF